MKGFSQAIRAENERGWVGVIPDIKCCSPKEGDLLRGRDPVAVAVGLVDAGAPVLSVVTEPERFGGSSDLLQAIAQATKVPILRKDFFTEVGQIDLSAELGATAVLLICATLSESQLTRLYDYTLAVGLEPLVEVHTAAELAFARQIGAQLIGINNRNILVGETDEGGPGHTLDLLKAAPVDALVISESAIASRGDVEPLAEAGVNAVLVGTSLWQAPNMAARLNELRVERRRWP
ncbi:MAG: indole-3-glycerol-phosphate synthase [Propionibacteriaceae bacterium]|nr:indole-3-glycerol-phosphate synthase [Propionibacteriaceae bacterium]